MYRVIERVFGEQEGFVMKDLNLRVLLLRYMATFGALDKW
jgi:hypothetical protein